MAEVGEEVNALDKRVGGGEEHRVTGSPGRRVITDADYKVCGGLRADDGGEAADQGELAEFGDVHAASIREGHIHDRPMRRPLYSLHAHPHRL